MDCCPDCNHDSPFGNFKGVRGDGNCSKCGGFGIEDVIIKEAKGTLSIERTCRRYGGDGVCPTCRGQGEV